MNFASIPFPTRSVAIAKSPIAPPRGYAFSIIIFIVLGAFFTVWQLPGLIRDVQINQDPVILGDADVIDGECSNRRGLTDCEARLVYSYDGKDYDTFVSMAFLDFHSGDYTVDVVISEAKPELATLSLGLDMLWNRLAVFSVLFLLFAGGAVVMIFKTLQAWSANRRLSDPAPLRLVPVEISAAHNDRGGTFVSYFDRSVSEKSKLQASTRFAKGVEPLMSVNDKGVPVGVAVLHPASKLPVLLDSRVERLDLMPAEREAILAATGENPGLPQAAKPVRRGNPFLRGLVALVAILVVLAIAVFGYWFYYVSAGNDAFETLGMEINNIMPEPLNTWGCAELEKRFGDERAPFGCTADDYTSWK